MRSWLILSAEEPLRLGRLDRELYRKSAAEILRIELVETGIVSGAIL
jgi:hypothetical protein